MKYLPPAVAALCCVVWLCGCKPGAVTQADPEAQQRLQEEQQAAELSRLHEREAAVDEQERVLAEREQQLTVSTAPPEEEASPAPQAAGVPAAATTSAVATSTTAPAPADGGYQVDASFQTFYQALAPYGAWEALPGYGYVWQPAAGVQDAAWRPYTLGHWADTDEGWMWMSDEPFGWIAYHYGRWMRTHTLGWVWTPGDQWAPAWVSWRYGNDFVGWAPLPPEARFDGTTGIQQWADAQYDLGASDYTFIPAADFGDDSMASAEIPDDQAGPVYEESNNITNIYYDTGAYAIFCYGPSYDFMSSKARRALPPPLALKRYGYRAGRDNRPTTSGGTLRVPAPRIVPRRDAAPPPGYRGTVADSRLVTPSAPPPPHGAPVPPLYRPPVPPAAPQPVARASAPEHTETQQAPLAPLAPQPEQSERSLPGAQTVNPAAGAANISAPLQEQGRAAPRPNDQTASDGQITKQQQAAREAEQRQQEAEAARAAAEQRAQAEAQHAEEARAQEQRAEETRAQEQRAEELRAEEAAREQRAAQEAVAADAARTEAAREEAAHAAGSNTAPAGTPGSPGKGQ